MYNSLTGSNWKIGTDNPAYPVHLLLRCSILCWRYLLEWDTEIEIWSSRSLGLREQYLLKWKKAGSHRVGMSRVYGEREWEGE